MDFWKQIEDVLGRYCVGPIMVHSDLFGVLGAVEKIADRQMLLARHMDCLERVAGRERLIFPTFNYDFTSIGQYDVQRSPSQVGKLSEYARTNWADWRSMMPVFNFCGKGNNPLKDPPGSTAWDPFDQDSLFAHVADHGGGVLFYGAEFHSFTAIHFIERISGGPIYRYDKYFEGEVETRTNPLNSPVLQAEEISSSEVKTPITLKYHVRPMGFDFSYDWPGLLEGAVASQAAFVFQSQGARALYIALSPLRTLWMEALKANPLYLLTQESQVKVSEKLNLLGRPFVQADFEPLL